MLGDWVTLADGRALTDIQSTPTWPFTSGNRNLTDEQVALPSFVGDMPGDYTLPRYGFSTQWSKFVIDRASAGQTPPGSSGPGPNLGQDVSMSSPVTNVKTTSGTTWTAAPRAVMTAPASSVETILTGVTQPVTIPTSAPIQVESPALLKPVSLSTQAQPEMSTITITE